MTPLSKNRFSGELDDKMTTPCFTPIPVKLEPGAHSTTIAQDGSSGVFTKLPALIKFGTPREPNLETQSASS